MAITENINMKIKAIEKKNFIKYVPSESVNDCNCFRRRVPFSQMESSPVSATRHPTTLPFDLSQPDCLWLCAATCSPSCISRSYHLSLIPALLANESPWTNLESQTPIASPTDLSSQTAGSSLLCALSLLSPHYIFLWWVGHEGQHGSIIWMTEWISVVLDQFSKRRRECSSLVVSTQHDFE